MGFKLQYQYLHLETDQKINNRKFNDYHSGIKIALIYLGYRMAPLE